MKAHFLSVLLAVGATLMALPVQAEKIENFNEMYKQPCDFVSGEFFGDDWCNPGNAAGRPPNVVLVGDSYSNSAVGMLDEYARIASKKIIYEQYGRGQCPSLLDYGPDWCGGLGKAVYERVKKTPSIQTVVFAANWSYYWETEKKFSATGPAYSRAEFEKSFVTTVKAYQALGKKVVVMYQSPGIVDPKVCVQRRFQPKEVIDQCYLPRSAAETREAYREFINPVRVQLKLEAFDPYEFFCDAKECKLKDGDKIFKSSYTHLSGFGGQYLARKAAPELKKLLQF